jgi:type 2 lantibiotic biosynthesis protein LanM
VLARAANRAERRASGLAGEPAWLTELTQVHRAADGAALIPPNGDGSPFAALAEPVLARARDRLADQLTDRDLLEPLYASLPGFLDRVLTRTMVLELAAARKHGGLSGDTPQARFAEFCAGLRDGEVRRRLLSTYPVLGRLLVTAAANWVRAGTLFADRLAADRPRLDAVFGTDGPVVEITGLGDPHAGGQTVLGVRFAGGARLVYKPRPVRVDVCFQQLLEWLGARGMRHPLHVLSYVDGGGHGWVEFVTSRGDGDPGRFHHRLGGLLALLYLLRGNDLSAENLIAAGEHPVLIDLEALCQPELAITPSGATAAETAAMAAASSSVLRAGLLPIRTWGTADGRSVDLSGLGRKPGQLSPMVLPVVEGAGTDRMRLALRRVPLDDAPAGASPRRPLDHVDDILAGFTEVYELCRRHRAELLAPGGPLAVFAGVRVRVILRSTVEYALLRQTGFHPDVLRDGLDTDRHFDRLRRGAERRPALSAVVEHERRDLWGLDIPSFTVRTDETVLRSGAGAPVPGLVVRTGMDCVRRVAARLGPADLSRQRWLIRASLAASAVDVRDISYPSYPLPASSTPADPRRLMDGAEAIGRHLATIGYRGAGSAEWLGVISHRGQDWSLGPLGADLCTGLSGIALFLGQLGALTGQAEYTDLARDSLATARSQVDRRAVARIGGAAGLGGILYACVQLGVLWQDEGLLDHAVQLAVLNGSWADQDDAFDFATGGAGSIAALRALHTVRPLGAVREAARRCAERVLAGQHPAGGWLAASMEDGIADAPLAGFAHGAAGVAAALLEAAVLCGERRFHDAAVAGIAYERELFLPAAGNWRDLRRGGEDAPPSVSAWCHGAAGVGMARALCQPLLPDDPLIPVEITTALDTTLRIGFGTNHSLCHGDVGNLELLLLAADALGEPRWHSAARTRMSAIMDSIDERGWITGLPHGIETPGLLHGLAGIGYGMLRLAAPERVPSVLTFAPPPPP